MFILNAVPNIFNPMNDKNYFNYKKPLNEKELMKVLEPEKERMKTGKEMIDDSLKTKKQIQMIENGDQLFEMYESDQSINSEIKTEFAGMFYNKNTVDDKNEYKGISMWNLKAKQLHAIFEKKLFDKAVDNVKKALFNIINFTNTYRGSDYQYSDSVSEEYRLKFIDLISNYYALIDADIKIQELNSIFKKINEINNDKIKSLLKTYMYEIVFIISIQFKWVDYKDAVKIVEL